MNGEAIHPSSVASLPQVSICERGRERGREGETERKGWGWGEWGAVRGSESDKRHKNVDQRGWRWGGGEAFSANPRVDHYFGPPMWPLVDPG